MHLRLRLTSGPRMCERTRVHASPFPVPVWGKKKGGPLSGCMRYFCWASHIEQTNNLFQLKQAADAVSAERELCSIGSHHPFNQKKKTKKKTALQHWLIVTGGERRSFRSRYSVKHGDARSEWRARSNRVP